MASPAVEAALEAARNASPSITGYQDLIANFKSVSDPDSLDEDVIAYADAVLGAQLGVIHTRTLLNAAIDVLRTVPDEPDTQIVAASHILEVIPTNPLASSLVEQSAALHELAAAAYEAQENFLLAAKTLEVIPLDSSQRRVPDADKAAIWIRIVRNYLEVDDATSAETYLNKLKNVMHTVDNPELLLHFRLSAARIQDSNRQFLQAAQSYHDISLSPAIAEDERLHTLGMAVKCAVLAPAGPLRARALGRLYKDERSAGLAEERGMLEKMFLDRLLSKEEVESFARGLAPHQLARTSDGSTVLARAVVEHNLLGASRLYRNIGFDELGVLLGLDGDKAEETTARMIEQGRLAGSIDQIERVIWFEGGEASGEKGSGRAEVPVGKEMRRWDGDVQALAEDVERLTDALQAEFPEFVAAQIAV